MHRSVSKLEKAGFRLFSIEPVSKFNSNQVEIAMIHKDWTPSGWHLKPRIDVGKEAGGKSQGIFHP